MVGSAAVIQTTGVTGGADFASLAGNDIMTPFAGLRYCSSGFFCARITAAAPTGTGGVATTLSMWNGSVATDVSGGATSVFTCNCSPIDAVDLTLGSLTPAIGPMVLITPVAFMATGDFWDITYSGTNGAIVTIDYDTSAGADKTQIAFWAVVIWPRERQTFNVQASALGG